MLLRSATGEGAHKKRGRYKNFPSESAPYMEYGPWYKLSSVIQWLTVTSNSLKQNPLISLVGLDPRVLSPEIGQSVYFCHVHYFETVRFQKL